MNIEIHSRTRESTIDFESLNEWGFVHTQS